MWLEEEGDEGCGWREEEGDEGCGWREEEGDEGCGWREGREIGEGRMIKLPNKQKLRAWLYR